MPQLLNPKRSTFPVSLKCDIEDYPDEATRPAFIFRALSSDQQTEYAEKYDAIKANTPVKEAKDAIVDVIVAGMVGWRNMNLDGDAIPFDATKITSFLTFKELMELALKMLHGNALDHDTKKESGSQPQSDADNSASDAALASA